jgi:hypothetical protein
MVRRVHIGIGIVVVIIAVVLALILLAFSTGAISVSGPTTLSITKTPTVVEIGGTQYVLSLHGQVLASNVAYLYIGRSPVFINPTLNVTLILDNYTKISGNGSTYANMEIKLDSLSNTVASITITPLQTYLAEPPDYGRISVIGQATGSRQNVSAGVTIASTTVASTTTINQTAAAKTRVLSYLKINEWYGLMANYTKQYQNSVNCTPLLYNNTFRNTNKIAPVPPNDYWNASVMTPYNMVLNVTNVGSGDWAAVYTTLSKSPRTTGQILKITVNASTGTVLSVNQTGYFKGQSFVSLQSSSLKAASVGNACGIEVII